MMKKVPKRRFKGFLNAGDWEQRKLGEVFGCLQNNTLSRDELNYKVPNVKNIHYGDILIKFDEVVDWNSADIPFINNNLDLSKYSNSLLRDGDIVFADTAEDDTVGKAIELQNVKTPYALAGLHTIPCRSLIPFGKGYMGNFLNSESYRCQLRPLMQGIKVSSISKQALKNTTIKYPLDLLEQSQIGNIFFHITTLLTLHQRKLEKLQATKKALLYELFPIENSRRPKRRFKGFTDDWEQRKLGELGKTFNGLTGKTKKDFGHGDAQYITYLNVFQNTISDLSMTERIEIDKSQNTVQYGDILFTTSSETPEEVGMSSVWLGEKPNTYLNSFCFGYRPTVDIDHQFMGNLLRSPHVRNEMKILAQGISRYNISKNKVMDLEITLPSKEEQKLIGSILNHIDSQLTLHQRKLEKLKNLKAAYLNEMFV